MFTNSLSSAAYKPRLFVAVVLFLLSSGAAHGQTEKAVAAKLKEAGQYVKTNDAGHVNFVALKKATDALVDSINFGLLPQLTMLTIDGDDKSEVTDKSLIHLRKTAKNLTHVAFERRVRISGKELGQLLKACPSIRDLELGGPEVTDETMSALSEGKSLTNLTLFESNITDKGLKRLKHCENLRDLSLFGCSKITDAGIAHVVQLPKLYGLILMDTKITNNGLATFGSIKNLTVLSIPAKLISDTVREGLTEQLPGLQIIEK
jgi:Leucine Rich repeat